MPSVPSLAAAAIAALIAVTVGAAGLGATAAGAATFGLAGGTVGSLPGDFDPWPGADGLGPGDTVRHNATLSIAGPARVSFRYVGSEAGYDNRFLLDGVERFGNKSGSNPAFTLDFGSGTMPVGFATASPAGRVENGASRGEYGSIAFLQKSPTLVYALFNDSATVDRDFDDMVVRMEIAPVPLPAAAWMLIAGIGGLGALARRRSAARHPAARHPAA